MTQPYTEKLQSRISAAESNLCIGLDPRPDLILGDVEAFLHGVIADTASCAAAFKPNIAYFEALGPGGIPILENCLKRVPEEIPVVLDVKRSDIPETMKYYAKAYFEQWGVDAVTINGLMGCDSIEPFLQDASRGVYLLGVTSNPGSADVELQQVDGRYVFELMQDFAARSAHLPGSVGLVTGLTTVTDDVLDRIEDLPLLIPGLGAQGGELSRLRLDQRRAPLLINASRSILYGSDGTPATRAQAARDKIRQALQPSVTPGEA